MLNNKLELLGFAKDNSEFLPHVTVGRINPNQKKKPDISNFLNSIFMELPMKIVKIHLMQSQSFPKGSFYTILGSHFLGTKLEAINPIIIALSAANIISINIIWVNITSSSIKANLYYKKKFFQY